MSNISVFNAAGDTGSTCLDGSPNTIGGARRRPTRPPSAAPRSGAAPGTPTPARPGGTARARHRRPDRAASASAASSRARLPGRVDHLADALGTRRRRQRRSRARRRDLPGERRRLPDRAHLRRHELRGAALGRLHGARQPGARTRTSASSTRPLPAGRTAGVPRRRLDGQRLRARRPRLAQRRPPDRPAERAGASACPTPHASIVSPVLETPGDRRLRHADRRARRRPSTGNVRVTLLDANGHAVGGKTVTLAANAGSHVMITPASGVSDAHGSVVFTVTGPDGRDRHLHRHRRDRRRRSSPAATLHLRGPVGRRGVDRRRPVAR